MMKAINEYIIEKLYIDKNYKAGWKFEDFKKSLKEKFIYVSDNKSLVEIKFKETRFPYFLVRIDEDGFHSPTKLKLRIWTSYSHHVEIDEPQIFQMDENKSYCLYNEYNAKIIKNLLEAALK